MSEENFEIPIHTDFIGPHGNFIFIPYKSNKPKDQANVCAYLINSPGWHPLWSQYMLAVVSLAEFDGVPTPSLKFDDATHELLVVALDPDKPQNLKSMLKHCKHGTLPFLSPVNIVEQFKATDDEMEKLAWLCCRAVVNGSLIPETADAPTKIREAWLAACLKTLAHFRGEAHSAD